MSIKFVKTDWLPQQMEFFVRKVPYTRTQKQELGKKLFDEIMDSIFLGKIKE